MNKELYLVFLPAISALLFALGGTQISSTIKGWKGWRRFILPTVYLIACVTAGTGILRAFGVAGIAGGVFSAGYGNGKSWAYRGLIGVLFGAISLPIGFSFWNIATALTFISLFWLSNWKPAARVFNWALCSAFFGFMVGIEIGFILAGR